MSFFNAWDDIKLGVLIPDGIAVLVGVVLLVISIVTTVHARDRRLPCVFIACSVLSYILNHVLDILDMTTPQPHSVVFLGALFPPSGLKFALAIARWCFSSYTDVFALSATFAVLWHRTTALAVVGETTQSVVKRTVDAVLLCLMALFVSLAATVDRLNSIPTFILAYFVLWAFMICNLGVSTVLARRRVSRIRANDTPITVLTFALLPLWTLHLVLLLVFAFLVENPTAIAVESEVLPALIVGVIAMLGLLRTAWTPLGNVSDAQTVTQLNMSPPQWEQRDGYYIPVDFTASPVTNGRIVAEV